MKLSHLTEMLHGVFGEFLSLSSTVASEISLLKGCGRAESSVLCSGCSWSP